MNAFIYTVLNTLIILILNQFFLKKNYLINVTGDKHQKFASKKRVPLTGGILIFISLLYNYDIYQIIYFFFYFLILLLGISSDLKILKSAKIKLIFQLFIILVFIYYSEIEIYNTRIFIIDDYLQYKFFNIIFVCFCILVVINGSNFIDGLNTLNAGYYLIILLILNLLVMNNQIETSIFMSENLLYILIIFYIINFFNKIFLGDSGAYLLSFLFSILLINIYKINPEISPFFIVLLLWYPAFETLFSILRKNLLKLSSMRPDSRHLHQLIYYFIKKKYFKNVFKANLISANLINIYNLSIFYIASQSLYNTQIMIVLIILNLFIYTFIYFKLFFYRFK